LRKEERAAAADDILSSYIAVGSPHEINIASALREAVIRRVNNNKTSIDAFADAEREVMLLIRRNVFDSFVGSEGYLVCQILIKSSNVSGMCHDLASHINSFQSSSGCLQLHLSLWP
jgi:hypothetical protein